jgi:hypothetical protein
LYVLMSKWRFSTSSVHLACGAWKSQSNCWPSRKLFFSPPCLRESAYGFLGQRKNSIDVLSLFNNSYCYLYKTYNLGT